MWGATANDCILWGTHSLARRLAPAWVQDAAFFTELHSEQELGERQQCRRVPRELLSDVHARAGAATTALVSLAALPGFLKDMYGCAAAWCTSMRSSWRYARHLLMLGRGGVK